MSAYRFGPFEVRSDERQLLIDGQPATLGARAFDLLLVLVERRNRIVTKSELLDLVWPGLVVEENNLQVQISTLRKLLGPKAIATIPGRGYQFALGSTSDDLPAPGTSGIEQTNLPWPQPSFVGATNLQAEPSRLYGRDTEIHDILRLVKQHRLVSIVGAAGIGKTRLAQAVAHRLRSEYADGVWSIELAAVSEPTHVAGAVAQALTMPVGSADEAGALAEALRSKSLLLVIDNCEHVLDAVGRLAAAIQRTAPGTYLLTTGQEPLRIADEHVYRLGTLSMPAPDVPTRIETIEGYGAVALFVARVQAVDPRFALNASNVTAILDICRRLDGMALALELAAARVPLLGVEGVRRRLDERFKLLTTGARTTPQRHQTLRAALDWSHALLSDSERVVFRRLGVFWGGFSLEVGKDVVRDSSIDDWEVLDCLGGLVDKSLVVADTSDPPRYRLLETTRAYALERLEEAGESQLLALRHAQVFHAFFETSWSELWQASPNEHLAHYRRELDNVRAAIGWSSGNDHELEIALTGAAAWVWYQCGLNAEGMAACERALLHVSAATPKTREARVLSELARLGQRALSVEAADRALDRAIAFYRGVNDRVGMYLALSRRAVFLAAAGNHASALSALNESAFIEEAGWPPRLRLQRVVALSWVLEFTGPIEQLAAVLEERLRLARLAASENEEMAARCHLVRLQVSTSQFEDAIRTGLELADLLRQRRLTVQLGGLLPYLGAALAMRGRLDEAVCVLREAAPTNCLAGTLWRVFDVYALIAALRGQTANAARLFGAGCAMYARLGHRRQIAMSRLHEEVARRLQCAYTPELLSGLMQEGETMPDSQAVALALTRLDFTDS